ncbi:outer membrane lipoprotein carrier protein LolA [candidate division KSB1 bacterium]
MKRVFIISFISVLFICVIAAESFSQRRAKDVINIIQEKYKRINDLKADLLQIEEVGFYAVLDTAQIKISLLKEDYFRIESTDAVWVTDGKISQDFNRTKNILTIDDFREDDDTISPKKFLFEFPDKYNIEDFRQESKFNSSGFILEMVPKKPDDEMTQFMEVWVDAADSLVKYVRTIDFNESEKIFILGNYVTNTGLTKVDFEIKTNAETRPIDLRKKKGSEAKKS